MSCMVAKAQTQERRDLWISLSCVPVSVERTRIKQDRGDPWANNQQVFTQEIDIDFRVSGLPHAVVIQADNFRVRELVKKIGTHLHRAPLQADLQQNNVYNPFSKNSKAMIREMGNVELFELCETIPKLQCSECLLCLNQGLICCTCGQVLVGSEFSQKLNKLSLDALSILHYVIKKARPRGSRHGKTEAQKKYHVELTARKNITKEFTIVFLRHQVYRESQLKIGWTGQKCIEMDKLAQEDHSNRPSRKEFKRCQRQWYLTLNKSGKNAPMRLRTDFQAAVTIKNRLHRESGEERAEPIFSTKSKMAPFFLKWFLVELGRVQKLVELMSSIHFLSLFVAVGFVDSW